MKYQKERLLGILDEIFVAQAQSSPMIQALQKLVVVVDEEPLLLWEDDEITRLAKAAVYVLFCDIIEDENEEIQWALRTFSYITQALVRARDAEASSDLLFEILRHRVMLMHSHDDFFFETFKYFLFHDATDSDQIPEEKELNMYLRERVAAIQYQDLITLERYVPNLNNDEFLNELVDEIEERYHFDKQQLAEAQLLSDTLFKFVWYQQKHL